MKKLTLGAVSVICLGCAPVEQPVSETDIEAVIGRYVQSVNSADYGLLREIWVETDEISYVNPLDRLRSSEQLEGFWQAFITDSFSERDLRPTDIAVHLAGPETAWAVFDWEFAATTTDGQPFNTSGWETQFYRLTGDGWRIEHVHYSTRPPPQEDAE